MHRRALGVKSGAYVPGTLFSPLFSTSTYASTAVRQRVCSSCSPSSPHHKPLAVAVGFCAGPSDGQQRRRCKDTSVSQRSGEGRCYFINALITFDYKT